MRFLALRRLFVLIALLVISLPSAARAADWDGEAENGLWSDPLNWSNDRLPGYESVTIGDPDVEVSVDMAVHIIDLSCAGSLYIDGFQFEADGFVTIDRDLFISNAAGIFDNDDEAFGLHIDGALTIQGGHLYGRSHVTVNGPSVWAGGSIKGPRNLYFTNDLLIANGPDMAQPNTLYEDCELHTSGATRVTHTFVGSSYPSWYNYGTVTVEQDNDFQFIFIVNEPSGVFRAERDCVILRMANYGRIEVDTLRYFELRGHLENVFAGEVVVGPGANFVMQGGHFTETATVEGEGSLVLGPTGSDVEIETEVFDVAEVVIRQNSTPNPVRFHVDTEMPNLALLHGGVLTGSGNVTVTESMLMHGGSMTGDGTTIVAESAELTIDADDAYSGQPSIADSRALINRGTGVLLGHGTLHGSPGAQLVNADTGQLTVHGNPTVQFVSLVNEGAMDVDAEGIHIRSGFWNEGDVHVIDGWLLSSGVGETHVGTFDLDEGTILAFRGTPTLTEDAAVTGAGTLQVEAGQCVVDGEVDCGIIRITGGKLRQDADATAGRLELEFGGLLEGEGAVVVDTLEWTGGSMAGTGETHVLDSIALETQAGEQLLLARTLRNEGSLLWTGDGAVSAGSNDLFINEIDAVFDIRTSTDCWWSIENHGTVIRLIEGTTVFKSAFENDGDLTVVNGQVRFQNPFHQSGGRTEIGGGGILGAPFSNVLQFEGGTLGGDGLVDASVNCTSAVLQPEVPAGAAALHIAGDLDMNDDSAIVVRLGSPTDRVIVSGAAALAGTLNLERQPGAVLSSGDEFRVVEIVGTRTGEFASVVPPSDLPAGLAIEVSYETSSVLAHVVIDGCPADVDGSGDVGVTDILAILTAWGPCAGCPADLDGDGVVGVNDLIAVLGTWGPCGG